VLSGHDLERRHDRILPWQEIVEPFLRVSIDAGNNVGQIAVRLDAEELAAFDQRGDDRPILGAGIGTEEQEVLAGDGNRAVILPTSGKK
jgi:hypothetical protein